jgi:hypothetical protein
MPTIIDDPTLLNELIHVHVFGGSVEPTSDNLDVDAIIEAVKRGARVGATTVVFRWNGNEHRGSMGADGQPLMLDTAMVNRIALDVWTLRNGQDYQADIEAHVAAYRGHIPDYVGDGAWLAKGIERVIETNVLVIDRSKMIVPGVYVRIGDDKDQYEHHNDLAIAFWNAAVRACGYTD